MNICRSTTSERRPRPRRIPYTESCLPCPAYCEVALPVPLDHTFTYGVRLGQSPQRGARVIVPFRNEKLIGVVTALGAKAPPDFEVRYLEAVLDEEPLLSEHLWNWASGRRNTTWHRSARCCAPCCRSRPKCAAPSTTALPTWAGTCWPQPSTAIQRTEIGGRESASRARAVRRSFLPKARMWSAAFWSGWLPVNPQSLHIAHRDGGVAATFGRHAAQEVDRTRDRRRRARCAAHGALCRAHSRHAPALADRKAAGDSG